MQPVRGVQRDVRHGEADELAAACASANPSSNTAASRRAATPAGRSAAGAATSARPPAAERIGAAVGWPGSGGPPTSPGGPPSTGPAAVWNWLIEDTHRDVGQHPRSTPPDRPDRPGPPPAAASFASRVNRSLGSTCGAAGGGGAAAESARESAWTAPSTTSRGGRDGIVHPAPPRRTLPFLQFSTAHRLSAGGPLSHDTQVGHFDRRFGHVSWVRRGRGRRNCRPGSAVNIWSQMARRHRPSPARIAPLASIGRKPEQDLRPRTDTAPPRPDRGWRAEGGPVACAAPTVTTRR